MVSNGADGGLGGAHFGWDVGPLRFRGTLGHPQGVGADAIPGRCLGKRRNWRRTSVFKLGAQEEGQDSGRGGGNLENAQERGGNSDAS